MHVLFALAAMCSGEAAVAPLFMDAQGRRILPEDIPRASSLTMELGASGREFRIELHGASYRLDGLLMKQNMCEFSVTHVNGVDAYGSVSFCSSVHGSFILSGLEYEIRSVDAERVEIRERGHVAEDALKAGNAPQELSMKRAVKIFLINDAERVQEIGPEINLDTSEIFRSAKSIFEGNKWLKQTELVLMGTLNIVDRLLDSDSEVQDAEARSIERLRGFADAFQAMRDGGSHPLLTASDVVFLLRRSDTARVNGLTFIGGAGSPDRGFGVVELNELDSYFYKGKVLAHEISHSLGAVHSVDGLMKGEESPTEREEDVVLSSRNIGEMEAFMDRSGGFGSADTCGSGFIDGAKECDSGLPFGSACCTRDCRLRPGAQCDDRNGKCCRGCMLMPRGARCGERPRSVYKTDCEENSYCDGKSSACMPRYARDGSRAGGGVCKRGVAQTEALVCQRLGRFFSPRCSSPDGRVWCLDEYNICSPTPFRISKPRGGLLSAFADSREMNSLSLAAILLTVLGLLLLFVF